AKSCPIHYPSLPSVVSSARAFTLARRASKRASGEHTGEFALGSSPGAVWICDAISRKLQNHVSANCEMLGMLLSGGRGRYPSAADAGARRRKPTTWRGGR